MVAASRALEFEAPDGFVRDPFASRLAGERGMAILNASPNPGMMRFAVGVRSRFVDELLLEALVSNPIAAVLSVGCGLDTRPWRLDLPPDLRWIEADFADILDYKESVMSAETPRCRRERLIADVNDPAQRRITYAAVGSALGPFPTAVAGYLGPSLFGVGAAALIRAGYIVAVLWLGVIGLLAIMAVLRKSFGVVSVVLAFVLLFGVAGFASVGVQVLTAYAVTWFLLVSGVKMVRIDGKANGDARKLRTITKVPHGFWWWLWQLSAGTALVFGATLLV